QDPTGNDGNDGNNDAATTTNPNMSTATTPPDSENDGNDGNDGDNVPTTSGTTNMANPTNSPKDNNKGKKKGKDNKGKKKGKDNNKDNQEASTTCPMDITNPTTAPEDDGEGKKDPKGKKNQDPTGTMDMTNPTGTDQDNGANPSGTQDSGSIPTDTSENDSTDPNVNPAEANPLGGVKMPKIQKSDDGAFIVNGNRFVTEDAAHGRQCDIQHNLCANKSNGGDKSFSVGDCDQQNNECRDGPPVFE
ncbi:25272_t:CDS:2, partial [Gigaspora rosea]